MAVKTFHQISRELSPFVLCDLDEASFGILLPVLKKFGFAYTRVTFEDHRKVSALIDNGPCLLLCQGVEGKLPAVVESAHIPTLIIGGTLVDIDSYPFPVVWMEKTEMDLDTCDFFIGRIWAARIDELQKDFRDFWENIKKKSNRDLKKKFELQSTTDHSRKELWSVLSQISSRVLNFLKVQIDSSKSLSASIENYLENHPDLVCIYKGSFFGEFDLSKIKPSMHKNSYLFLLWKDDWPLLMICTEVQIIKENCNVGPQFSIILQQELSIIADLLFKFGPGPHTPWQGIFNSIPVPMAVFSKEGEILIHNKEFTRLPLGQAELQLAMKEDLFEAAGETIRIFKETIPFSGQEHLLMTFLTIDSLVQLGHNSPRRDTVKDLGIIAGSLAHELNNPIAGIMTAVSVLETDSQSSEEVKQELEEIKKCALRCQELIHIFLGLSRVNLHSEPAHEMGHDVHHVLEQAVNLLRFRMVESGITLDIRNGPGTAGMPTLRVVNSSVLAMIFYLLLNHLLSWRAHKTLVQKGHRIVNGRSGPLSFENSHLIINFQTTENYFSFSLKEAPPVEIFLKNKLFLHLLELIKIEIRVAENTIQLGPSPIQKRLKADIPAEIEEFKLI
ncbi:MAG: hypothetical protein A2X86_06705 [Bdellovibrionales bacterium GWA2_49_15]|nr:MAG: hypothetical protein A2X86_06705 [Bdellovibrionales bacterium GWA2_49_15]HAZ12037.1 hypothetical protein [Bdellovibrionales bacterium]